MQTDLERPPPLTGDARAIATMLGLSWIQFLNRRRRLEAKGFPRPLPIRPLRWSIVQIEDWLRGVESSSHAPRFRSSPAGWSSRSRCA